VATTKTLNEIGQRRDVIRHACGRVPSRLREMVANEGAELDAYHKHRAGGEKEELITHFTQLEKCSFITEQINSRLLKKN
jgi:hypothetical protein